ncbi:hypothetical protein CHARACLAT_027821 [Characodon lateralis]|uniref:Uncharacterized protein n=1 Tax=Characodon lateralis TaxID=208331 RepID=A0ABU7EXB2_9TELE|nr:hypothetical protein [Characodon lateralis]
MLTNAARELQSSRGRIPENQEILSTHHVAPILLAAFWSCSSTHYDTEQIFPGGLRRIHRTHPSNLGKRRTHKPVTFGGAFEYGQPS